jgi:hypothetical protein
LLLSHKHGYKLPLDSGEKAWLVVFPGFLSYNIGEDLACCCCWLEKNRRSSEHYSTGTQKQLRAQATVGEKRARDGCDGRVFGLRGKGELSKLILAKKTKTTGGPLRFVV